MNPPRNGPPLPGPLPFSRTSEVLILSRFDQTGSTEKMKPKIPLVPTKHEQAVVGKTTEPQIASEIAELLRRLQTDIVTLLGKTCSLSWHMAGRDSINYRELLSEHATELTGMSDVLAEQIRTSAEARQHEDLESDRRSSIQVSMLRELAADNRALTSYLQTISLFCEMHFDLVTAKLIKEWHREAEHRVSSLHQRICEYE